MPTYLPPTKLNFLILNPTTGANFSAFAILQLDPSKLASLFLPHASVYKFTNHLQFLSFTFSITPRPISFLLLFWPRDSRSDPQFLSSPSVRALKEPSSPNPNSLSSVIRFARTRKQLRGVYWNFIGASVIAFCRIKVRGRC